MNLKILQLTGVGRRCPPFPLHRPRKKRRRRPTISTLWLLVNASQQNPTQICQPVFCNFAAHPLILPKHHFFELAESYAEDLRTFVRNHEQLRLRKPVNDPPSRLTWIHKRNTRAGIVQPAYLVVGETDIAKSRHIAWVAIHDMKFTISILYLPVTEILCCQ